MTISGRAIATAGWGAPQTVGLFVGVAGWLDFESIFDPSGSETVWVGYSHDEHQEDELIRCKKRDAEILALIMLMRRQ